MAPIRPSLLCWLAALTGCAAAPSPPEPEPVAAPYAELVAQGIDRYLGQTAPISAEEGKDGVVTYTFDMEQGPGCLRGAPYRVAVRDRGSEDLIVFMQGGGACWSDFCFAIENAPPGIPGLDVLDGAMEANPFADWNVVYLPYCDGSLFAGDTDVDEDGDGLPDRYHRGLANLSAALDVARDVFGTPERLVLAGSSGGGFGTIPGAALARLTWPEIDLDVINDAGIGVVKDGVPQFIEQLFEEFGATRFVPPSCPDCLAQGHLTPLIGWQMEQDPRLRVAAFSAYDDYIISQLFLQLPPNGFRYPLVRETRALSAAHPGRYERFLVEGTLHTALIGDVSGVIGDLSDNPALNNIVKLGRMDEVELEGVTVAQWLEAFVGRDGSAWRSMEE